MALKAGLKTLMKEVRPRPFDRNKDKAVMSLNQYFIKKLSYEERKSFALLLKIKQRFVNSIVYEFSPKALSKKIGISEYNIKKHVAVLLKKGYARVDGDNLIMLPLNDIIKGRRRREHSVTVNKDDSLKDILYKLNLIILKNNFYKQNFCRRVKRNGLELKGLVKKKDIRNAKDVKRVKKFVEKNKDICHGSLEDYNYIGMRKCAELIGCSLDTAARMVNYLKGKKIIKTQHIVKTIKTGSKGYFDSQQVKESMIGLSGHIFRIGSYIYIHMGTSIELLPST